MYYSQLSSSVWLVNKDARRLNENRTGTFYNRGECLTANVGGIKNKEKLKELRAPFELLQMAVLLQTSSFAGIVFVRSCM